MGRECQGACCALSCLQFGECIHAHDCVMQQRHLQEVAHLADAGRARAGQDLGHSFSFESFSIGKGTEAEAGGMNATSATTFEVSDSYA